MRSQNDMENYHLEKGKGTNRTLGSHGFKVFIKQLTVVPNPGPTHSLETLHQSRSPQVGSLTTEPTAPTQKPPARSWKGY